MKARHPITGMALLILGLAAAAPAQELTFSIGAGRFLASEGAYRQVYGSGPAFAGDIWLKLKGRLGLAAGFNLLPDRGMAVPMDGGDAAYPLKFRRTSIPLVVYYEFDVGDVAVRLGAGIGFHSYKEIWQTADLEFEGHKVSPRIVLGVSWALLDKLSLLFYANYDSIRTGAGSSLAKDVDLGGFQLLGGLAFRVF
jgi:hypothetical protein